MKRVWIPLVLAALVAVACGKKDDGPSDSEAPTLVSSAPADSDLGVSFLATPSAVVSESLDPATVNSENVLLTVRGVPLRGNVTYDEATLTIRFEPLRPMERNLPHVFRITSGVTDLAGNGIADTSIAFNTFVNPQDRIIGYDMVGNVTSWAQYSWDFDGRLLQLALFAGTGPDLNWFTADDVPGYYIVQQYDAGNVPEELTFHNGPGLDGNWFTPDDDILGYFNQTLDSLGNLVQAVSYTDPGLDGQWKTSDDVITGVGAYVYDANFQNTQYTLFTDPGADTNWFTTDDVPGSYGVYTFDTDGNDVQRASYNNPGPDATWFTADDIPQSYTLQEFDGNGNLTRNIFHNGAGPDAIWFTTDDVVASYNDAFFDSNGLVTNGLQYTGPGVDGVWLNADDDVNTASFVTYSNTPGNVLLLEGAAGPGPDGIWGTTDDGPIVSELEYDPSF